MTKCYESHTARLGLKTPEGPGPPDPRRMGDVTEKHAIQGAGCHPGGRVWIPPDPRANGAKTPTSETKACLRLGVLQGSFPSVSVCACVVVRERRGGGTERKKSPEALLHLYFKNSSRRASERDGILSPGIWVTSLSRDVWAIQLLMLGPKEICPHLESGRGPSQGPGQHEFHCGGCKSSPAPSHPFLRAPQLAQKVPLARRQISCPWLIS